MHRQRRQCVIEHPSVNIGTPRHPYTHDRSAYENQAEMSLHDLVDSDDSDVESYSDGLDSPAMENPRAEGSTPIKITPAPIYSLLPEVLFHEEPAPLKPLLFWTRRDVIRWLASLGSAYKIYAKTFYDNGIDGKMLHDLTDEDMRTLKVGQLHRKKLLMSLREMSSRRVSFRDSWLPEHRNSDGFDASSVASFSPQSSFNSRSRTVSRPSNSSIASPKPLNANQKQWQTHRSYSVPTTLETSSTYAVPGNDTLSLAMSPGSGSASRKNSMDSQVSTNGRDGDYDHSKYGSTSWDTASHCSLPSQDRSRREIPRVNSNSQSRPVIPYHHQQYQQPSRGSLARLKQQRPQQHAYTYDHYEEQRYSKSSDRSFYLEDPDLYQTDVRPKAHSYPTSVNFDSRDSSPVNFDSRDSRLRGISLIMNEPYPIRRNGELSPVNEDASFAASLMRSDPTMTLVDSYGRGRRISTTEQSETTTGSASDSTQHTMITSTSTNSRYTVTSSELQIHVESQLGLSAGSPEPLKIHAQRMGYVQVYMDGGLRWVTNKDYEQLRWSS